MKTLKQIREDASVASNHTGSSVAGTNGDPIGPGPMLRRIPRKFGSHDVIEVPNNEFHKNPNPKPKGQRWKTYGIDTPEVREYANKSRNKFLLSNPYGIMRWAR